MRRLIVIGVLIFCFHIANASTFFQLKERKLGEKGAELIAINKYKCPVSVSISIDIENLKPNRELPCQVVIPPNSEVKVLSLTRIKRFNKWSYRYHYKYVLGDAFNAFHDDSVIYHLPFLPGRSYRVVQGYNGTFSHQNKNSIDFNMAEGDTIVAARAGIVLDLEEIFVRSCPEPECSKYGNYIRIMHNDGSVGEYFHLLHDGALVEVGEEVEQGQIIGLSGNTGFSRGPHLHFTVYLPSVTGDIQTIKTRFLSRETGTAFIEESKIYTAQWD